MIVKNCQKMICVLLSVCMLLGVMLGGCSGESVDPTGGTEVTGTEPGQNGPQPQRPADPGAVPPLGGGEDAPENGIVWDMESIPDELTGTAWATATQSGNGDYVEGRVQILGVDGKGYQGSRAFAVRQNSAYNWSDIFNVGMKKDETAVTKWSFGEIFWIWYDATELAGAVQLEIKLNGVNMSMGVPYYTMDEGQTTAKCAGVVSEAWSGAGYGRIPVTGGVIAWVGVPLSAFGDERKINSFTLHLAGACVENPAQPLTLYLDNFIVTSANQGPMGASLVTEINDQATSDAPAWDMENLPEDLMASYWGTHDGVTWDGYLAGNIKLLSAAGKGVNGSRAFRHLQVGDCRGSDVFSLEMSKDATAKLDWTGKTMLWFWVDTTELSGDLHLDLALDGHKAQEGAPYYGINKNGQQEQAGQWVLAWDGADYGRMTIGAGYKGWVGVPMSAFGYEPARVYRINFYIAYDQGVNIGCSAYFDEIWVLNDGELPQNAAGADISVLAGGKGNPGGNSEENSGTVTELSAPKTVWDMEKLPADLLAAGWAVPVYADNADFAAGNVSVTAAAGKGLNGSTALAYMQNGNVVWADEHDFVLSKDSSTVRDWQAGRILWLWIDTSEMTDAVHLDLTVDGKALSAGREYYQIKNGQIVNAGKIPVAWEGVDKGRITVAPKFSGWIGIPYSSFMSVPTTAEVLRLYFGFSGSDYVGKHIYLDAFTLTGSKSGPNGETFAQGNGGQFKLTQIWDMEKLPDDPQISQWVTPTYADSYQPGNTTHAAAAGKGYQGSKALAVTQNNAVHWADVYNLNLYADSTATTDWTGAKVLWIWVNASEMPVDTTLEFVVGSQELAAGKEFYHIKDGKVVSAGTLPLAYDGAAKARIPVASGFVGWIGIPFSTFKQTPNDGSIIQLGVCFNAEGYVGKTMYFDAFTVSDDKAAPDGATFG